jgi:hypothetical protein
MGAFLSGVAATLVVLAVTTATLYQLQDMIGERTELSSVHLNAPPPAE